MRKIEGIVGILVFLLLITEMANAEVMYMKIVNWSPPTSYVKVKLDGNGPYDAYCIDPYHFAASGFVHVYTAPDIQKYKSIAYIIAWYPASNRNEVMNNQYAIWKFIDNNYSISGEAERIYNDAINKNVARYGDSLSLKMEPFKNGLKVSAILSPSRENVKIVFSSDNGTFSKDVVLTDENGIANTTLLGTFKATITAYTYGIWLDILDPICNRCCEEHQSFVTWYNEIENISCTIKAEALPSISIEKIDDPDPVKAGEQLTYTIWINNTGFVPACNVIVKEEYDENFIFISANPSPTIGNNIWEFPCINAGESISITIVGITNSTIKVVPISPIDGSIYYGINGSYNIEITNNPFYSIKYETIGEGVKNGGWDIFSYTINKSEANKIEKVRIQAKSACKVGSAILHLMPGYTAYDTNYVFEFLGKTDNGDGTTSLRFKVINNNCYGLSYVAISLPDGKLHNFVNVSCIKAYNKTWENTTVLNPPIANDDYVTTLEDTPVVIDVLANDSDVEDGVPELNAIISSPSHGVATINPNGTITYEPNENYCGDDSFIYEVIDSDGLKDVATVYITILPVNDAPVANDDYYTTDEDVALVVDAPGILANDTDVDGNSLHAILISNPSHGSLVLNENGSFVYTPDADFNGMDNFTYVANDGSLNSNVATVYITILPVNDAPVANDDYYTTDEDVALVVDAPGILANDTDVDGNSLHAILISNPSHGSLVLNENGSFVYTPDADFNGMDNFTYVANDGSLNSNVATVYITILPVNDAPVANDDYYTTDEDVALVVDAPGILANDTDVDGNSLHAILISNPSHGSLVLNENGSFVYTPDADFNGMDNFTYVANDGSLNSNVATVYITILPVNDAPVANDDYYTTDEDVAILMDILTNDTDADGFIILDSIQIISYPSHGSLIVNSNGTVLYTPDENYYGSDEFSYTVEDNEGAVSNVANVYITVLSVNDPPIANDDYVTTLEDTPVVIDVLANDSDVEDGVPELNAIISSPSHGIATINPNGTITYEPYANYYGSDSFIYEVIDSNGATDPATVHITIIPVNDPPVALNDSATTEEDTSIWIDILANDYDIDGTVDTSTISIINGPFHGSVNINYTTGEVEYIPNANCNGKDSFNYTVKDNDGAVSNIAEVIILIGTENDPPVANDDYITVEEGKSANLLDDGNDSVLDNDYDVDGDILQASLITPPAHGSLTLNSDGTFVYTHDGSETTSDFFVYAASDGLATDTATVYITIIPVNDSPVAVNDAASVDEDTFVFINLSKNDYDIDGDIDLGSISIIDYPAHGLLEMYLNGTVKYTPYANYHGNDEFNYTIKDNEGAVSNVATVFITVLPVNDPPIANDDYVTVEEDSSDNQIDVLANDTDGDGDSLEIISVSSPSHGTVYHDGNYIYYTPEANYCGSDGFTYTISDGYATDTATVYITIECVNDPPVANDDYATTYENNAIVIDVLANDSDADEDLLTIISVTSPLYGSVINNGDSITYTPYDGFYGSDFFNYTITDGLATDTATVYVNVLAAPKAIINIEKIGIPNPVKVGKILQYVINVSNSGNIDANGIIITDDYDETSLEIINYTSGGFNDGDKITWNIDLQDNSFKFLFVNVSVKEAENGTIIINFANYSYENETGEAIVETTVLAYEIKCEKIAIDLNAPPFMPEDEIEYRIWINNTGGITANNATFIDLVPENTTYVSSNASFGSISYENDSIIWNGDIPTGSSLLITMRVKINEVASSTIISNQGFLYYDDNIEPTDDPTTLVPHDPTNITVLAPSLTISKSASPSPVEAGKQLTYTITVTNNGDAPAYDVVIREQYDSNFIFTFATPSPDEGTNNRWSIGTIEAGNSVTIIINGIVANNNESSIINIASYTSSNAGNGRKTIITQVIYPAISIQKEAEKEFVEAGEIINFTISYSNPGDIDLTGVIIHEVYPNHTKFVSANPMPTIGNDTWELGMLPAHSSGIIKITLSVDSPLANNTVLTNYVNITCNEGISDEAIANVTVISSPELVITKSDSPDPVEAGKQLTYTITVTNNGNEDAENVIVVDTFDSNYLTINQSDGGIISGDKITWEIPLLKAGESKTFVVTADVKVVSNEIIIHNFVNASCNKSYGEYEEDTTITPPPSMAYPILEITKDDLEDPVYIENEIIYEIIVKNIGDAPATNVVVTDLLGDGLSYVDAQPAPYSIDGNKMEWYFSQIDIGEIISIYLHAKAQFIGVVSNEVNVTCSEGIKDSDNETTQIVDDNEPPYTRKVFHGEVYNVSMWDLYILHYIPKDTYITLKAIDNGTGVNHTYYRIWKWNDSEEKWSLIFNWKEYYGEEIHLYELEGYGKYEIEFYSVDKKGNVEGMEWNDVYVYE